MKRWILLLFSKAVFFLAGKGMLRNIPDESYLRFLFYLRTGAKLRLDNPCTFGEKVNWLKIHDRRKEYIGLVDKYEVKKTVSSLIGPQHVIPTYGVWNNFDEIDFDKLPKSFVLKCTHDSGSIVIVKDKDNLDKKKIRMHFNKCLKKNIYDYGREWAYKEVTPRIIAEKRVVDDSSTELKDYKIFCFNGNPKIIQVDYERFTDHKRVFFNDKWERLDMALLYRNGDSQIEKPQYLEEMLEFARVLSKSKTFVRTDFYEAEENVLFGEMTFYPESGFGVFVPKEWNEQIGNWIAIDNIGAEADNNANNNAYN